MMMRPPLRPPDSAPWPARPVPRRPGGRHSAPHGAPRSISGSPRRLPRGKGRRIPPGGPMRAVAAVPLAPVPGPSRGPGAFKRANCQRSSGQEFSILDYSAGFDERKSIRIFFLEICLIIRAMWVVRLVLVLRAGQAGREPTDTAARRTGAVPGQSGPTPAIVSLPWSCARRMDPAPIAVGGGPARRMSRSPLAADVPTAGSARRPAGRL
jgi:hypothetical protein